jgi:hypothetical protein
MAAVALIFMVAGPAPAEEHPTAGEKASKTEEIDAEMQAMHDAWMKAGAPGEPHQRLAKLAGEWDYASKFWPQPGCEPMIGKGVSRAEMIFGGRYLVDRVEAEMMGMPFEGMSITGYDNVKEKYVGVWIDSMSTMIMYSEGVWDEEKQAVVMEGEYMDPVSRKLVKGRSIDRALDDDHHLFEFYQPGPDGELYKSLEITYTRRK